MMKKVILCLLLVCGLVSGTVGIVLAQPGFYIGVGYEELNNGLTLDTNHYKACLN
jgi:hypothetical protein